MDFPVLVVTKNAETSLLMHNVWSMRGITTETVNSMQEAILLMRKTSFMFAVIDADSVDYLPLLKIMREAFPAFLFVITTHYDAYAHAEALNHGAHHYGIMQGESDQIVKTLTAIWRSINELMCQEKTPSPVIIVNDIMMHTVCRQVFCRGIEISPTRIEFDILHYLMANHDCNLSYKRIYQKIWKSDYDERASTVLYQHVFRLRKRFLAAVGHTGYIDNIPGTGYRLSTVLSE